MPPARPPIKGVGVDLISLVRAQAFFRRHGARLCRKLLSAGEKKRFQESGLSAAGFAKLFAAKEAFFKALNEPWLGIGGFRKMDVTFHDDRRFSVRSSFFGASGQGCFFLEKNWVGAQVILWEK